MGTIFERIISLENLFHAYKRARKGKRYREDVANFDFNLEANLIQLHDELKGETYKPGEYENFRILDPKPRLISKAPFRERVVHHAIMNVIEPILDRSVISDTYACRVSKGTHKAADRAQEFARQYVYVLKADIVQFFPSIDLQILMEMLRKKIEDEMALRLLQKIVDSGQHVLENEYKPVWFPGDDLLTPAERPRGLPIGNLTSQVLANFYLNPLDQFIKRRLAIKGYVRYCDDFLIFGNDREALQKIKQDISRHVEQLRLIIHKNKSAIYLCNQGFLFVGYRIYPYHRRLRRGNISRFRKRMKHYAQLEKDGQITRQQWLDSVRSWLAHASHANTYRLRQALFKEIFFAQDTYLCEEL